ncbi:MAG: hypothetical protein ACFFDN_47600 [Candidatus Hodarchaeota archaeon]
MKLFQPRFPYSVGGRPISFLRVVKQDNGNGLVIKITDQDKKQGSAIARCAVVKNLMKDCYQFYTSVSDAGHKELCSLLCANGIKGRYREWLEAVERGNKEVTEEMKVYSEICFDCDPIEGDEASGWKFRLADEFVDKEIVL